MGIKRIALLAVCGLAFLPALTGCSMKPAEDAATKDYKGPAAAVPPPNVHKRGMENIPGARPGGAGGGGAPMTKQGG